MKSTLFRRKELNVENEKNRVMEEVTGTKKNSKSQGVVVGVVVAMCLIGLVAYFAVDGNWFERLSKAEWCVVCHEAQQQGLYPCISDEVLIMEALGVVRPTCEEYSFEHRKKIEIC